MAAHATERGETATATILVVDDDPLTRTLLVEYLADHYQVVEAKNGTVALEITATRDIDLVLLDVVMPDLDGFDVVRALRGRGDGPFLPVILLSGLTDQASRRTGLAAGADEFLSKPFDPEELLLRVRNLLALRDKECALLERNVEHAELRRFRDEMSALVVHDLKNPLSALGTNIDFALAHWGTEDGLAALQDADLAARRLGELVENLADVQRLEATRLTLDRRRVRIDELLARTLAARRYHAERRQLTVAFECPPGVELAADENMILRAIENILDNAFRYAPPGGRIAIAVDCLDAVIRIRIGNSGAPVPAEARVRIFEKFGQAREAGAGRANLGLGLYFCRLAVEAHGGRIWLESTAALPTIFAIELPR